MTRLQRGDVFPRSNQDELHFAAKVQKRLNLRTNDQSGTVRIWGGDERVTVDVNTRLTINPG
jgi:hypothetical protein